MKTIKHCNQWDWGVSILITAKQGRAAVTLSFENENPGVCFLSGLSAKKEPFLLGFYKKFGFQEIKDEGPVVRMTKMMRL